MHTVHYDPGGKRKPSWPADAVVTAQFSACNRYRYELTETWNEALPRVMFLMMNPSVAGIEHADPTLIKTGKFARAWGCGGQLVGNVHAYRVTDSKQLVQAQNPVGPDNDAALLRMARQSAFVVLAFGLPPKPLRPRATQVVDMLKGTVPLKYLRLTQNGTPSHPLYLHSGLTPRKFMLQRGETEDVIRLHQQPYASDQLGQ